MSPCTAPASIKTNLARLDARLVFVPVLISCSSIIIGGASSFRVH